MLTGSAHWLLIRMPVSHQSLQAVALDPDFSKKRAKMYVTGGDKVTTVWASTQNSRKSWTCVIGTFYLTTLLTLSPRRSEILQIDGDGFKILLRQASGHKKKSPFGYFLIIPNSTIYYLYTIMLSAVMCCLCIVTVLWRWRNQLNSLHFIVMVWGGTFPAN